MGAEGGEGITAFPGVGLCRRLRDLWVGPVPPAYRASRWLFLRALGAVYLIAFLSLAVQIVALAGDQGLMPAGELLDSARAAHGRDAYRLYPTLAWLGAGDLGLRLLCWGGAALAVLLIAGMAPMPVLFLLWIFYLSLTVAGGRFLGFQWDALLLETGLLAVLYAPAGRRSRLRTGPPPSPVARWLLWWLLFRLMFLSGATKLASGDPTWADWTALAFHFETQPLPSWIAWHADRLSGGLLKMAAAGMYAMELAVPFLILTPERWRAPRRIACVLLVLFQLAIAATGNYGFFNLLTIVLCLALLDDGALRWLLPGAAAPAARPSAAAYAPGTPRATDAGAATRRPLVSMPDPFWKRALIAALAIVIVPLSAFTFVREIAVSRPEVRVAPFGPGAARRALEWVAPFRSINGYGLFRIMTTERPEITIQGSRDAVTWIEYDFRWKPDAIDQRPRFVAPHMPRLDWQMWFAALGPQANQDWLLQLARRLLQGEPAVTGLFDRDPFQGTPPQFVRFVYWRYRFATPEERREAGVWWTRERLGTLTPPLTLEGSRLRALPDEDR